MRYTDFPEGYEELTPEQAKDVFELHLMHVAGDITERDMKVELICRWLKLGFAFNYKLEYARKTKRSANVEHLQAKIYRIAETMHWLYRTDEQQQRTGKKVRTVRVKTLAWDGLQNFFGEVLADGILFCAPNPFYTISAGQYIAAMGAMRQFNNDRTPENLNRFFATLYIPERPDYKAVCHTADFDGRRNEPFNQLLSETYYAQVVESVPEYVKYAAVMWFNNWDKYLKTGTITIEGEEISFAPLFKGGSTAGQSIGLTGILLSIAEEGAFGTIDSVMNRPLIDIYVKLYNNYLALKNMRKK